MVGRSHRGFREWIVQRVTALLIGVYTIFMAYHAFSGRTASYAAWHALFSQAWVQWATLAVLLAILWHAWIGLWTVLTDYVKPKGLRFILEAGILILFVVYILRAICILW